eukprot:2265294-Pleurochrysis_carterae.AAC.1
MSQHAIDSSAVLGFVRNQVYLLLPPAQPGVARCAYRYCLARRQRARAVPRFTHHGSHISQQHPSGATSANRLPLRDCQVA